MITLCEGCVVQAPEEEVELERAVPRMMERMDQGQHRCAWSGCRRRGTELVVFRPGGTGRVLFIPLCLRHDRASEKGRLFSVWWPGGGLQMVAEG